MNGEDKRGGTMIKVNFILAGTYRKRRIWLIRLQKLPVMNVSKYVERMNTNFCVDKGV